MFTTELTPLTSVNDGANRATESRDSEMPGWSGKWKIGVALLLVVAVLIGAAAHTNASHFSKEAAPVVEQDGMDAAMAGVVEGLIPAQGDDNTNVEQAGAVKKVRSDTGDYDSSSDAPAACPRGTYLSGYRCVRCPAGYRCPGNKQKYRCSPGTYQASSGKSTCVKSPCGSYVPGYGARGKLTCPAGKYSGAGARGCSTTPAGTYTSAGSCAPKNCGGGYYQASSGKSSCTKTSCGYYAPGPRSTGQSKCPAGKYSGAGASGCSTTPAGTYTSAGSCAPKNCGPGKYQPSAGQSSCATSPCGYYAPGPRSTGKSVCPAGKYSGAGASSCATTPAGTYTSAGSCAPKNCGPGKYQPSAGQSSCATASCGYYAAGPRSTGQAQCPAGKYSGAGASGCSTTPAGTYTSAGSCAPKNCGGGFYQNAAGQPSCKKASCGYYAPGPRSLSQARCPAGKYSGAGASACATTPAGKYSSAGSCNPTSCPAGSYQNLAGQSGCKKCGVNTYQALGGQAKCNSCRGGFCAPLGSRFCSKCGSGSESDEAYLSPLYRYYRPASGDHFYTTNAGEIGTTTPGRTGRFGYKSEGIACYVSKSADEKLVPLYRYWNGRDHFYTTNAGEIGTTRPGTTGRFGYRSEGVAGYVSATRREGAVPLYRYYAPSVGDHFYTTNAAEIGTTQVGAVRKGYRYEGVQCYVWTSARGNQD